MELHGGSPFPSSLYSCTMRPGSEYLEDQFFVEENKVRWISQGTVEKCFTLSSQVLQVGWSQFMEEDKKHNFITILHLEGLLLHSQSASLQSIVLPCPMEAFWSLPNGLLFARSNNNNMSADTPIFFSLLHRLEEIKPLSYLSHNGSSTTLPNSFLSQWEKSFLFESGISEADISGIFEEADFITDPLEVVFASIHLPIIMTYDKKTPKLSVWLLHEKHSPYNERSYETAQQYAALRSKYEELQHKAEVTDNLIGTDIDASFRYDQTSFLQDSFTIVSAESQIKAQIYLEWIVDFPCLYSKPKSSYLSVQSNGIFIYLQADIALLRLKVSYENHRYKVQLDYEIPCISSIPVSLYPHDSFTQQDFPGLDLFGRTLPQTDIIVLDEEKNIFLYHGTHKMCQYSIPENHSLSPSVPLTGLAFGTLNHFFIYFENDFIQYKLPPLSTEKILRDVLTALQLCLPSSLIDVFQEEIIYSKNDISCSGTTKTNKWQYFCDQFMNLLSPKQAENTNPPESPLSDWDRLINDSFHKKQKEFFDMSHLHEGREHTEIPQHSRTRLTFKQIQTHLENIHESVHLLFETYKLSTKQWKDAEKLLIDFLLPLSRLLGLEEYEDYYFRQSGIRLRLGSTFSVPVPSLKDSCCAAYKSKPISLLSLLSSFCTLKENPCQKFIKRINSVPLVLVNCPYELLRRLSRVYHILGGGNGVPFESKSEKKKKDQKSPRQAEFTGNMTNHAVSLMAAGATFPTLCTSNHTDDDYMIDLSSLKVNQERVCLCLIEEGFCVSDLEDLSIGISLPLHEAIYYCRQNPPLQWPTKGYLLIGREDLAQQQQMNLLAPRTDLQPPIKDVKSVSTEYEDQPELLRQMRDGTLFSNDSIIALRFSKDKRLDEVSRLLSSAYNQIIELQESTGTTEHELLAIQQKQLHKMGQRTMARPIGRGMYTLATSSLLGSIVVPIPPLELGGTMADSNGILKLSVDDAPEIPDTYTEWPQFHNGVAAALRISPTQKQKSQTWILYNKPKTPTNNHAGFLFGLGLQNHLNVLKLPKVVQYLKENHPSTSAGLLLGLAAAKRGTMEVSIAKLLSIHIPALHPRSSSGVDVVPVVQISALMSVGLLYMESQHRGMTKVLLDEINRSSSTDKDFNRESYALTAGLSLGFVTLGKGKLCYSLTDLQLDNRLMTYIHGSHEHVEHQRDSGNKSKSDVIPDSDNSSLVLESNSVNINITAPGATLAYGMLYLQTEDMEAAQRLRIPSTLFLLETIRPDVLLLRILCKNLIIWNTIIPLQEWIQNQLPPVIKEGVGTPQHLTIDQIHTIFTCYIHLLAGCCLSIGLRFAGTSSQDAFDVLRAQLKEIVCFKSRKFHGEMLGKSIVETCIGTVLISIGLVMAGSGNLDALKLLRQMQYRKLDTEISYGHHMACSMAIGFLFLGGGKHSLQRNTTSIAALLCSVYPLFPADQNDNRYHLQALRHFYVLACSPRCLNVRDVESDVSCCIPLKITLKESTLYARTTIDMVAPCIIPEFHEIESIEIQSPRYYPNICKLDMLHDIKQIPTLFVKRKSSHQPYAQDPKGFRSIFARSFPNLFQQQATTEGLQSFKNSKEQFFQSFSGKETILSFVHQFCNDSLENDAIVSFCTSVVYECLCNECPEMIFTYLQLGLCLSSPDGFMRILALQNTKFIQSYYHTISPRINLAVIQPNFLTSLDSIIETLFAKENIFALISSYLEDEHTIHDSFVAAFLSYKSFPSHSILRLLKQMIEEDSDPESLIAVMTKHGIPPDAIVSVCQLFIDNRS